MRSPTLPTRGTTPHGRLPAVLCWPLFDQRRLTPPPPLSRVWRTGARTQRNRSKNGGKAEHMSRCCSAAVCGGRRQRPLKARARAASHALGPPLFSIDHPPMRGRGSPQPNRSQWRTKAKLSSLASYGGAVAHAAHTRLHEPRHHTAGCRPARHGREHVWPCRVWGRLGSSPHGPTNGQVDGTHPSDPRSL